MEYCRCLGFVEENKAEGASGGVTSAHIRRCVHKIKQGGTSDDASTKSRKGGNPNFPI